MENTERGSDCVITTYREIAVRFGLTSGPDAGRLKAKRAGWPVEPRNHPSDPVRVRVPRDAWDAVPPRLNGEQAPVRAGGDSRTTEQTPATPAPDLAALIAAHLQPIVGELRAVRELADQRAEEIAGLRERVGRAEAERDRATAEREQAVRRAEDAEAALWWWTAGGPFARAARAFFSFRRAARPDAP